MGNITLNKIGDRQYVIQSDTYDFDMHDARKESDRNVYTRIGHAVSEGICINLDAVIGGVAGWSVGRGIGAYAGVAFMISAGLLNRHVTGTTTFEIYIDGTLNTR